MSIKVSSYVEAASVYGADTESMFELRQRLRDEVRRLAGPEAEVKFSTSEEPCTYWDLPWDARHPFVTVVRGRAIVRGEVDA